MLKIRLLVFSLFFSQWLFAYSCPSNSKGTQISHKYYEISYLIEHKIPEWTCHLMSEAHVKGPAKRDGIDFQFDPSIPSYNMASPIDYRGTGYDRGHMVPAADMKLNEQAMNETFYMTNVVPQNPGFNRGIWSRLEAHLRDLVLKYKKVLIVTGAVIDSRMPTISRNISIPQKFYKIAYFKNGQTETSVAYLMPNASSNLDIESFRTTMKSFSPYDPIENYKVEVEDIEELTGLNL